MNGGLTNQGLQMIQESQGTGQPLTFVYTQLGSSYPTTEAYETFTQLKAKELEVAQYRTYYLTPQTVQTAINLTLPNITHEFVYHELGIYAKVGNNQPKLYAYFYKEVGEPITQQSLIERTIAIEVFVDQATNVTITIDNSVEWINKKEFNTHVENTTNPHSVTKEQTGLGLVENLRLTNEKDLQEIPTRTYMTHIITDKLIDSKLHQHLSEPNPHNITKSTVGLGDVDNYHTATYEDTQLETAYLPNNKFTTPALVTHQLLNQILTGYFNLSLFKDYNKLLQKDKVESSPNIQIIPTEDGIRITYTGNTGTTIGWNDIIRGDFEAHPDVKLTLAKYIKNITSLDNSITVTKKENNTIDLAVNYKPPTFEEVEGDPLANALLQRLLDTKLEGSDIFNSDDIIKEQLPQGGICFKLKSTGKAITWKDITGTPSDNTSLTNYIKELALEPRELATYIKAGTNVSITQGADGSLTINSTGGGSGGGGSSTVSFADITGDPTSNIALNQLLQTYATQQDLLALNTLIGNINKQIGETPLPTTSKTLTGAINECFQSASEGKLNVMASVKAKHPETTLAYTDPKTPYMDISNAILNIPSGAELPKFPYKPYCHYIHTIRPYHNFFIERMQVMTGSPIKYVQSLHKWLGNTSFEYDTMRLPDGYQYRQSHLGYIIGYDTKSVIIYNLNDGTTKTVPGNYNLSEQPSPNGKYLVGSTGGSTFVKLDITTGEVAIIATGGQYPSQCNNDASIFVSSSYVLFVNQNNSLQAVSGLTCNSFRIVGNVIYGTKSLGSGVYALYKLTVNGNTATETEVKRYFSLANSLDTLYFTVKDEVDTTKYRLQSYDGATMNLLVDDTELLPNGSIASGSYNTVYVTKASASSSKLNRYINRQKAYYQIFESPLDSNLVTDGGIIYTSNSTDKVTIKCRLINHVLTPIETISDCEVYGVSPNGRYESRYTKGHTPYEYYIYDNTTKAEVPNTPNTSIKYIRDDGLLLMNSDYSQIYALKDGTYSTLGGTQNYIERTMQLFAGYSLENPTFYKYQDGALVEETPSTSMLGYRYVYGNLAVNPQESSIADTTNIKDIKVYTGIQASNFVRLGDYLLNDISTQPRLTLVSKLDNPLVITPQQNLQFIYLQPKFSVQITPTLCVCQFKYTLET